MGSAFYKYELLKLRTRVQDGDLVHIHMNTSSREKLGATPGSRGNGSVR
jgi:hypothetical protein